jgi:hypothetical protein
MKMLNKANSENDITLEMHDVGNYVLCVNSSVQRYSENEEKESV